MKVKNRTEVNIRMIRQSTGLGMSQFAEVCDISLDLLKKYERSLLLPDNQLLTKLESLFHFEQKEIFATHQSFIDAPKIGEGYVTAIPQTQIKIGRTFNLQNKIPILDLFCGIGGFSTGFENTNAFEVVAGVDLLGDRIKTFQKNHHQADTYCWNLYDLNPVDILQSSPNPAIIIGGPPCQGFSSIRPYRSWIENDRRNNLFEQFAYFVSKLKPDWFVLENVVGLITHNKGETLKTLVQTFESIGYRTNYKVLNAAVYGLPQSRERVIVVGNRNNIKFEFPQPTHFYDPQNRGKRITNDLFNQNDSPALTIMDAIHDLPEIASGEKATHYKQNIEITAFERAMRGQCMQLTLHESTLHSEKMLAIIRKSGSNISAVAALVNSGFSTSYSRLDPDKPSNTITVNFVHPSSNRCIHPYQDRALTPREGARLQSFPDNYQFEGSKTQIIKQIGNAVPPLLGEVIARQILKFM